MADPLKEDPKKLAADAKKLAVDASLAAKEAAGKAVADAQRIAADVIAKAQAAIPDGYKPFPVKAIATGYYDGQIRVYGNRFSCANDEAFASWMEPVNELDAKRLAARIERETKLRKQPAGPNVDPTGVIKAPIAR